MITTFRIIISSYFPAIRTDRFRSGFLRPAGDEVHSFPSGSPRPAAGRGAGGEGPSATEFNQRKEVTPSVRPPHPRPFSPAKPGEKGARVTLGNLFSPLSLHAGLIS